MSFYKVLDKLGEVNEKARRDAVEQLASNSSLSQSLKSKLLTCRKDEQVQIMINAVDIDKRLTPMELDDFRDKVES